MRSAHCRSGFFLKDPLMGVSFGENNTFPIKIFISNSREVVVGGLGK